LEDALTPTSTFESSIFGTVWATWGRAFSSSVMILIISMPGLPRVGGNINISVDLRIALCFDGVVMNICVK